LRGDLAAAQAVPRRVPVARVRPPVSAFRPSEVQLASGDRVVVSRDRAGVADALIARLEKRGVRSLVLTDGTRAELIAQLEAWHAEGPVAGVYWLASLDAVNDAVLVAATRAAAMEARVKRLYLTLRTLYDGFAQPGTFLVSATRMGGRHGYDAAGAADLLGGAVSGLTKSFARERPQAHVKVVDFPPSRQTAAVAERLLDETLFDAGVVEVGYADEQRWQVALEEQPLTEVTPLAAGGTFVITGAAGSIVSAIVADLAEASRGEFWLLDLTPSPDPADPNIPRLSTDREALKRDLFARLQSAGERATPARVEKEIARLERAAAALASIRAVEAAGGRAHYRSVDLRDAALVAAVLGEVGRHAGRVDVLLHAAGLEISRALPDKKPEEFDLVFDVKVDGWFNLLAGLGELPLGAAVVFSSIAGRFGNAGQADYSAANDLLCKAMSALPRTRGARGIAIDWTAWAEIGMAARGSIPAIMKAAGIDMLPPVAGIPVVRRELGTGAQGEVLIALALGAMLQERVPNGALDTEAIAGNATGVLRVVSGFDVNDGMSAEIELDPVAQPFLFDHQISGVPVLPGVMGIELMCEAARLPWPNQLVTGLERVEFASPFKFYRNESRRLRVEVRYRMQDGELVADCTLVGVRALHGRSEPERTRHFSAEVHLAAAPSEVEATTHELPQPNGRVVPGEAIYRTYFHGPAYQVLGRAWRSGELAVGELAAALPDNHSPAAAGLVAGPRLIELAFQTAGLAEIADHARMGLPQRIERVRFHQPEPQEAPGTRALARTTDAGYDVVVIAAAGTPLISVCGYATAALAGTVDNGAFTAMQSGAIAR
jgi:NAD(P)-dependent dehydrogenase (short-subunit alcohol dehydrogenase family)